MTEEYLFDKKIELVVDMRIKQLEEQLKAALSTVSSMQAKVETLTNQVKRLNAGAAVQQPIMHQAPQQAQMQFVQQPMQQMASQAPAQNAQQAYSQQAVANAQAQRQVSSSDVSVEKMFYFGNK